MTSFQITISPSRRAAVRFIASVRREIQKALVEEYRKRGLTQSEIARELKVHRSVINRELRGEKDIGLGRVGEFAYVLGRKPAFLLPERAKKEGENQDLRIGTQSAATAAFDTTLFKALTDDAPKSDAGSLSETLNKKLVAA